MSLWKARPAISFPCTAARFIFRMRMGLKANDGLTRTAYCDADSGSQITGRAYNQKPLLLADDQPTNVVRDTWTDLDHHIEH